MAAISSTSITEAVLAGWQEYQNQLVVVVRALTPEQLALRVMPNLRSTGQIAAHIIEARVSWFFNVLQEKQGDDELATMQGWDRDDQSIRTSDELAHGLEISWKLVQDSFARWTSEEMSELIVLSWIGPEYPITRAWVVWHVLEHDLHCSGEMTQTLGLSDPHIKLPPPPPDI